MPQFSNASKEKLASCDPRLQKLFNEVIKEQDCTILCGHRSEADQEKAYQAGTTRVHFPNSKHNTYPSVAVDVMPFPIDWGDRKRLNEFADLVFAKARELRIDVRWGADWDRDGIYWEKDGWEVDGPHWELL